MRISRRSVVVTTALSPFAVPTTALAQRGGRRFSDNTPPPIARDDFERNVFAVLDDIDKNQRYLNVSRDDGRMLRILAELARTKQAVEIGTSTGYSAIWIALALRNTGGRLITFEIDPGRASMARANFKRAGLDGLIEVVIGDAHKEIARVAGPVDFVFSDADKEGYLHYFRSLAPKLRTGGVYVSDNMAVPEPDPAYLRAITGNPQFETVFVNMHRTGTAISYKLA